MKNNESEEHFPPYHFLYFLFLSRSFLSNQTQQKRKISDSLQIRTSPPRSGSIDLHEYKAIVQRVCPEMEAPHPPKKKKKKFLVCVYTENFQFAPKYAILAPSLQKNYKLAHEIQKYMFYSIPFAQLLEE